MLVFLNIISSLLSLIPRRLCLLLGRQFGLIIYFMGIRRDVAKINLKIAFPQYSVHKRKSILINCYKHFGMIAFDSLRFSLYRSVIYSLCKTGLTFSKNLLKVVP